ncbi:rod shape-determining protein [Cytophagaceae bacterium YF14B1]|uniref:Rod shape-determining protein n=1 Tax=Xanthocytophaga flava TaxID=3048013 RepID=A0AAE3QQ94_9BACT|nr:rod shape-determining protein [Xanthocytophaga flavus]MDJ1480894.1 rod shape-determining protein [Xanthocytophaga flavus]
MSLFKEIVAVDPGSQFLRIFFRNKLVFNEPTQLSFDIQQNKASGMGYTLSTTPNDRTLSPINYSITDFTAFELLMKLAFKPYFKFYKVHKMFVCLPTEVSEVEKRSFRDSLEHAGAQEVFMIYQAYCAAQGMHILHEKKDFILIEWGASKLDISVFVNGFIVSVGGSIRIGTQKLISLIRDHISRKYQINLTSKEIEAFFASENSLTPTEGLRIGLTTISVSEIQLILDAYFTLVNLEIQQALATVDKKDLEKAIRNGIYYTGGASTYAYLRKQLDFGREIPYTLSNNPLLDTIQGMNELMQDPEARKLLIMT